MNETVEAVVGSIKVVGALIHCALFPSVCGLKTAQLKVQHRLIQKFMLNKFNLGDNTAETNKIIYCKIMR